MGWRAGAWATGAWAGTAWATQTAPTLVPDVTNDLQADGTAELQGDGFVVAVNTAYSSTVPAGYIVSQSPVGGSFAALGSTVTITVSLGPEPVVANAGGDDIPYRKSPHRGHDKERARLKITEEQRLAADIRAIYRELTDAPEYRERAEEIVASELPAAAIPDLRRAEVLTERLRSANRISADSETALRMLRIELAELLAADDERAIQAMLSQLL